VTVYFEVPSELIIMTFMTLGFINCCPKFHARNSTTHRFEEFEIKKNRVCRKEAR
jgi:hypothetical protein